MITLVIGFSVLALAALPGRVAGAPAHVGVIRWLAEHRVPIDVAAGTSIPVGLGIIRLGSLRESFAFTGCVSRAPDDRAITTLQ